jgi:hypothetical protein
MRYKIGAEQLQQVPSLVHRPGMMFRVAWTAPVGPTHAVCAATGATACGISTDQLKVLGEDWEVACLSRSVPAVSGPWRPALSRRGRRWLGR